jgi:hypothetical protein
MSTNKTGKTGLGKAAFFPKSAPNDTSDNPESSNQSRNEKVRTTIMLSSTTLAGLTLLKAQLRKKRSRNVTISAILDEAIQDLMKKEGVQNT